jgi:hypothetical protein
MLLHSAKCRRSESGPVSDMDGLTWNLDGPPAGTWASPAMMGSCTGTGTADVASGDWSPRFPWAPFTWQWIR